MLKYYLEQINKINVNSTNSEINKILKKNLNWKGSLDLRDTSITFLPKGLKVGGFLNLYNTKITSLPKGLKVGGSLDLSNTKITSLPSDLKVGGNLNLNNTGFKGGFRFAKIRPKGVKGEIII